MMWFWWAVYGAVATAIVVWLLTLFVNWYFQGEGD